MEVDVHEEIPIEDAEESSSEIGHIGEDLNPVSEDLEEDVRKS